MNDVLHVTPTKQLGRPRTRAGDFSYLPPGPWKDEPALAEWIEPNGLHCMVRRAGMGNLCGYVKVPRGHPAYRKKSGHAITRLRMHGGETFLGRPFTLTYNKHGWWVGFDCAHYMDAVPAMPRQWQGEQQIYRDMVFAKKGCADLAAQLASHLPRGPHTNREGTLK